MLIGSIQNFIDRFLLRITGSVYDGIRWLYDIFLALAKTNIFGEEAYNKLVNRIYIILGVFTLFILAYSLLTAVIDPEKAEKSEISVPNLIKNILTSLIIIVLLPMIFNAIFKIQNVILNQGTITKLILGGDQFYEQKVDNGGNNIAFYTYRAFFHPDGDWCAHEEYETVHDCAEAIKGDDYGELMIDGNLNNFYDWVQMGITRTSRPSFKAFSAFDDAIEDDQITFNFIPSVLTGIVVFVLILLYCIDLGIRVVKLAFYQMIAPITVICRVIPKQQKIFDSWLKGLISTFADVFVKIAVMCFGVFAIQNIVDYFDGFPEIMTTTGRRLDYLQIGFMQAFLIVGIILFIKQAPKLIKDVFGFEGNGGLLQNFKDTMKIGRTVAGLGAGVHAGTRNLTHGIKEARAAWQNGKKGAAVKQGFHAIRSGIGGLGSGAVRGAISGARAQNWHDARTARAEAAATTEQRRERRELYRAQHGNNALGVAVGHVTDRGRRIGAWAGIANTPEDLEADNAVIQNITNAEKELKDMTYSAMDSVLTSGSTKYDISAKLSSDGQSYTAAKLRSLHNALVVAQNGGNAGAISKAQKQYESYQKKMSAEMRRIALSSKSTIDHLQPDQKAAYKDMIVSGYKVRGAWEDGLDKEYVKQFGITSADFDPDKSAEFLVDGISYNPQNVAKVNKVHKSRDAMVIRETNNSIKREQLRNMEKASSGNQNGNNK